MPIFRTRTSGVPRLVAFDVLKLLGNGACWSFSAHRHGPLHFFNAPDTLAASPAPMLLPQELVDRDGCRENETLNDWRA